MYKLICQKPAHLLSTQIAVLRNFKCLCTYNFGDIVSVVPTLMAFATIWWLGIFHHWGKEKALCPATRLLSADGCGLQSIRLCSFPCTCDLLYGRPLFKICWSMFWEWYVTHYLWICCGVCANSSQACLLST